MARKPRDPPNDEALILKKISETLFKLAQDVERLPEQSAEKVISGMEKICSDYRAARRKEKH